MAVAILQGKRARKSTQGGLAEFEKSVLEGVQVFFFERPFGKASDEDRGFVVAGFPERLTEGFLHQFEFLERTRKVGPQSLLPNRHLTVSIATTGCLNNRELVLNENDCVKILFLVWTLRSIGPLQSPGVNLPVGDFYALTLGEVSVEDELFVYLDVHVHDFAF